MGIESGIGSIKPYNPEKVVKQRFGDCKDKSLLLVSLLKKIGIKEAYPVLVNTSIQTGLTKLYPSSEIFNHCIVKFKIDSTTFWVDPTIMQQGGDYKNLSFDDYGYALVIGEPSDSLEKIPSQNLRSAVKIKDELTVKSFSQAALLEIKSTRYGFEADKRRIGLEQYSSADITKAVADDLKSIYSVVNQTADLIVKDDINSNIISTTYHYEVDGFWKDGDKMSDKNLAGYWIFRFEPRTLYDYFRIYSPGKRKFDFAMQFPLNLNYCVVFHFPKDMLINDKYTRYENQAFFFDEKTEQISSNSFQITYNLRAKAPFIKSENYEKIYEEKNKIVKALPVTIYFNKQ